MPNIEALKAKIAKAKVGLGQSQILTPGDYEFVVKEAKEEYDEVRMYPYWYLRLEANGQATSDRFPLVDNMFWKLVELLNAVGLELESLKDVKDLVGRSGRLVAEKKGEEGKEITVYEYQPVKAVL
jgi:hypothetical protein